MKARYWIPATIALAFPLSASAEKLSANARIDLLPIGSSETTFGEMSSSDSLAFAYGFGAEAYYEVAPNIRVGIAPRYILNVKGSDSESDESASQFDIPIRGQYQFAINPQLAAYGMLSLGYSILSFPEPEGSMGDFPNPSGLIIGFGAGARFAINEQLFAMGELGYQLGFQSAEEQGVEVGIATNYLHIGVGVGSHF